MTIASCMMAASILAMLISTGCGSELPTSEHATYGGIASATSDSATSTSNRVASQQLMEGECATRVWYLPEGAQLANHGSHSASVDIPLDPTLTRGIDITIPLMCYPRDDTSSIEIILGAKKVNGEWRPAGGREKGCDIEILAKTNECVWEGNRSFAPEQNMQAVALSGTNWQGEGILVDHIYDDMAMRERKFQYCLYHDKVAICGDVCVSSPTFPEYNSYDEVLAVLNSIEFVDSPHIRRISQPNPP